MEDGTEVERVVMSDFKTEEEMHDALTSRGFERLSGTDLIEKLRMQTVNAKRKWRRETQDKLDDLKQRMEARRRR
jgi:hypothetical protein